MAVSTNVKSTQYNVLSSQNMSAYINIGIGAGAGYLISKMIDKYTIGLVIVGGMIGYLKSIDFKNM